MKTQSKRYPYWILLISLFILGGCGSSSSTGDFVATQGTGGGDPGIVEMSLAAGPITQNIAAQATSEVYAYNGATPGPQIEAKVGDIVVVHLTNNLPIPTTLHWHGVDLPATEDGSSISQLPVAPGETYTYRFKVLRPGLFWYHPHNRTAESIERGLYGTLLVRDRDEDLALALPTTERTLIIDDVLLDNNNQFVPFPPANPLERATYYHNGREGNHMLVNGQEVPIFEVESGVPLRWRILNAANTRFFRLGVTGRTLFQIGGDQGLFQQPVAHQAPSGNDGTDILSRNHTLSGLILTPGERADVVFTPLGQVGDVIYVESHDLVRGDMNAVDNGGTPQLVPDPTDGQGAAQRVFGLRITGGDANASEYTPPQSLSQIAPLSTDANTERFNVTFGHSEPDVDGNLVFFARRINNMPVPFPALTAEQGFEAVVGGTYIIEVTNLAAGMHNFHLHGFRMQLIETEYLDTNTPANNITVPGANLHWQDTVRIPARPGMGMGQSRSVTRLAVRFDDEGREGQVAAFGKNPGENTSGGWLMHCHINEHSGLGMSAFVNLREN